MAPHCTFLTYQTDVITTGTPIECGVAALRNATMPAIAGFREAAATTFLGDEHTQEVVNIF